MQTTSSFEATAALALRKPNDIAVLEVEDGSPGGAAARHLEFMRLVLQRGLVDRQYAPLATNVVDAAMRDVQPGAGETQLTPAWLKRAAGRAAEDALLAVHIDRWDESRMLAERWVGFQFQVALVAGDGELLWSGTLKGDVKAGGAGPAPRDRDAMARSCAELALNELLAHLPSRAP
jgi:hypothetical protein